MFEVQDLKFATLATVSRCGMVWFSEDVLSLDMVFDHFISKLKSIPIDEGEEDVRGGGTSDQETISPIMQVRNYMYMYLYSKLNLLIYNFLLAYPLNFESVSILVKFCGLYVILFYMYV